MIAMHRLGVTPDDIRNLLDCAHSDVATAGLSRHVEVLLIDLFRGTHFELDGLPEVALTSRGTRPGDPVGDILFNLLMVILMKDITTDLRTTTSLTWLGRCQPIADVSIFEEVPTASFCELAFVDDLAVLLRTDTIEQLWPAAALALSTVFQVAAKRGLMLNMDKGKTELLCALVGPGSKQAKKRLAASDFEIPIEIDSGTHRLRVVRTYKHLGGWVHDDAQPRHALRARATSAKQAWGPLLRPFFSKKVVSATTKVQVLNSLVLSRLTYNVHVLTRLSDKSLAEWEAVVRPMVAPLAKPHLRGQASFQFTTTTLCGLLEVLSPLDRLHLARLRYCKRLLNIVPWCCGTCFMPYNIALTRGLLAFVTRLLGSIGMLGLGVFQMPQHLCPIGGPRFVLTNVGPDICVGLKWPAWPFERLRPKIWFGRRAFKSSYNKMERWQP